jgi:hypothetical protein
LLSSSRTVSVGLISTAPAAGCPSVRDAGPAVGLEHPNPKRTTTTPAATRATCLDQVLFLMASSPSGLLGDIAASIYNKKQPGQKYEGVPGVDFAETPD